MTAGSSAGTPNTTNDDTLIEERLRALVSVAESDPSFVGIALDIFAGLFMEATDELEALRTVATTSVALRHAEHAVNHAMRTGFTATAHSWQLAQADEARGRLVLARAAWQFAVDQWEQR